MTLNRNLKTLGELYFVFMISYFRNFTPLSFATLDHLINFKTSSQQMSQVRNKLLADAKVYNRSYLMIFKSKLGKQYVPDVVEKMLHSFFLSLEFWALLYFLGLNALNWQFRFIEQLFC